MRGSSSLAAKRSGEVRGAELISRERSQILLVRANHSSREGVDLFCAALTRLMPRMVPFVLASNFWKGDASIGNAERWEMALMPMA